MNTKRKLMRQLSVEKTANEEYAQIVKDLSMKNADLESANERLRGENAGLRVHNDRLRKEKSLMWKVIRREFPQAMGHIALKYKKERESNE